MRAAQRARMQAAFVAATLSLVCALTIGAQQPDSVLTRLLDEGYAFRRDGQLDSAIARFRAALEHDFTNLRAARELGFAQIAHGDTAAATTTFRHIVTLAPGDRDDLEQLGYLELAAGHVDSAARAFQRATVIGPNDGRLDLQLAYAYEHLGQHHNALLEFERAATAPDTAIQRQAMASLHVLADEWYAPRGTTGFEWYEALTYGTRFSDGVSLGDALWSRALTSSWRLQAYLVARGILDTRTHGGERPIIFSDNYAALGGGVRVRPFAPSLTFYAEVDPAVPLGPGVYDRTQVDSRAGLTFGSTIPQQHTGWITDTYADASYYSRYADAIVYAQARVRRDLVGAENWLALTLRQDLVADDRGIAYNNLTETAAGFRLRTPRHVSRFLDIEAVHGFYLHGDVEGRSAYTELRLTLITAGNMTWLPHHMP